MSDRSMTLREFAKTYLGGKSAKTAKRRVVMDGIPHHLDHGTILIKESDAELWRQARTVTQAEPAASLKSLVARAVQRAKERRAS